MTVSKRTRFEVFKRDGFVCQYCGAHPPDVVLEVDHIIPLANEGPDDQDNLITSCFNCNRGKAANSLASIPQSLANRAAEIREEEDQIAGYRREIEARSERIEHEAWIVAEILERGASIDGIPRQMFLSIKRFNKLLPLEEVMDAAEITIQGRFRNHALSRRFKYFCGVCWNKIREGRTK